MKEAAAAAAAAAAAVVVDAHSKHSQWLGHFQLTLIQFSSDFGLLSAATEDISD